MKTKNKLNMNKNEVKVFENKQFGQILVGNINGKSFFRVNDTCYAADISNPKNMKGRVDSNDSSLADVTDMYIYHKLPTLTIRQRKADAFFDATDLLEQYNHIIEQVNNSDIPRFKKNNNSHNKIEDFFEWIGYKKRIKEDCYVFGVCDDSYFVKTEKDGDDVKVWLHGAMIDIYLRWMRILTDVHFFGVEDIYLAMDTLCEQRKICNKGREIY